MNNLNHNTSDTKKFLNRSLEEVEGGYWDGKGFYCTPEGSFWDEHGVYFNKEGLDIHGGFYDEFTIYNPGHGWIEEFGCYQEEMNLEVEEVVKEEIRENFNEELIMNYQEFEKYYRENDDDDVVDEKFSNEKDGEIFNQYFQNNLSTADHIGNSSNQNNLNYDKSDINSKHYENSLESSVGKNKIGSSNTKVNRSNGNN